MPEAQVLDPSSCANLRSDVVQTRLSAESVDKNALQKEMTAACAVAEKSKTANAKKKAQLDDRARQAAEKANESLKKRQDEEEARFVAEHEAFAKQQALDKIGMYRDKFKHVKKRNNVSAKSSLDEVLDEVHYIEMQLGSAEPTLGNPAGLMLVAGMSGLEALTDHYNPLDLKLTGLGQTTRQNMSKFEPLLDELMIKHGHNMILSVEWRLAMVIGTTVLTVHAANCGIDFPSNIAAASARAQQSSKDNYDDI